MVRMQPPGMLLTCSAWPPACSLQCRLGVAGVQSATSPSLVYSHKILYKYLNTCICPRNVLCKSINWYGPGPFPTQAGSTLRNEKIRCPRPAIGRGFHTTCSQIMPFFRAWEQYRGIFKQQFDWRLLPSALSAGRKVGDTIWHSPFQILPSEVIVLVMIEAQL